MHCVVTFSLSFKRCKSGLLNYLMAKGRSDGPNLCFLPTYTLAFSCSQVDRHNLAATAAFQSASAGGMGRLEEWMGARDEAHAKLCDTVRDSRDVD